MADKMETEPMLIDVYSFWLLGNNEKLQTLSPNVLWQFHPPVAEMERCDE